MDTAFNLTDLGKVRQVSFTLQTDPRSPITATNYTESAFHSETELSNTHPLRVVVYWMNNSERMALKHYLQITEDPLNTGCEMEPDRQVVANVVAEPSLIAPHVPSAKTQSLQKNAFPVTDRHGPSVSFLYGPQMGDEGLYGTRI